MKTRTGFVSNSSTSSFVIAFNMQRDPDSNVNYSEILESIIEAMSKVNKNIKIHYAPNRIMELDHEIENAQNEIISLANRIDYIKELSKNKETLRLATELMQIVEHDNIRIQESEIYSRYMKSPEETIEQQINWLSHHLKTQTEKQITLTKLRASYNKFDSEDWRIFEYEEDQMSSQIKPLVESLMKIGRAEIIENNSS